MSGGSPLGWGRSHTFAAVNDIMEAVAAGWAGWPRIKAICIMSVCSALVSVAHHTLCAKNESFTYVPGSIGISVYTKLPMYLCTNQYIPTYLHTLGVDVLFKIKNILIAR